VLVIIPSFDSVGIIDRQSQQRFSGAEDVHQLKAILGFGFRLVASQDLASLMLENAPRCFFTLAVLVTRDFFDE
jgi:hypothetical protein